MDKLEKDIRSLDDTIQVVQLETFVNEFEKAERKSLKKDLKKLKFSVGPLLISLIGFLIFKNTGIIAIGAVITGTGAIVELIKEWIIDTKKFNDRLNNKYILDEDDEVEQILQKGIGKSKGQDFYTEEFKQIIDEAENYKETDDEKKYKESLENQNKTSKIKLISNDEIVLNKDEAMVQIIKEIDMYTLIYNIPPLEISDKQWDTYFDSTYQLFINKKMEDKFYDLMSLIGRFVFSKSLLNSDTTISIYNFIDSLYYLEDYGIDKKEVLNLQKEIVEKIISAKIIKFNK